MLYAYYTRPENPAKRKDGPMKKIILILAVLVVMCGSALAGEIMTLDGVHPGKIEKITTSGGKTVLTHSKKGEVDCRKIISAVFVEKVKRGKVDWNAHVVLRGDNCLKGRIVGGNQEHIVFKTYILGEIKLDYSSIRAILFPGNVKTKYASYLDYVLSFDTGEDDVVFLASGNKIKGGILEITGERLVITQESTEADLPVDYTEVGAVKLFQDEEEKPADELRGKCYLSDGCILTGRIDSYDGKALSITSSLAGSYKVPAEFIERLYFIGGHIDFLSDMETVSVQETPFVDVPGRKPAFFYSMRRDRTVVGGKTISIRGREFMKGLGMMARTEATFKLGGEYETFFSWIGLDDEGKKGLGLVDFVVMADGKEIFRKEKVKPDHKPEMVKLDVEGVDNLTLIVDFHNDPDKIPPEKRENSGPAENWAAWGNALAVKKQKK